MSSGTSGILPAARSAKKTWRSAFDSGVTISADEELALDFMPSSNGIFTAAATASTHLSGAGKFFAIAPTVLRANWKKASAFGCSTFRSRTRGSGPHVGHLAREGDRRFEQVALDDLVEQLLPGQLAPAARS